MTGTSGTGGTDTTTITTMMMMTTGMATTPLTTRSISNLFSLVGTTTALQFSGTSANTVVL